MQKLPEHIDEIEAFYRGELDDHEVMPSPALWANISKNIPPAGGQTHNLGAPVRNWIIGSVSGVVALIGVYTYLNRSSSPVSITTSKKVEGAEVPSSAKNIYLRSAEKDTEHRDNSISKEITSIERKVGKTISESKHISENNDDQQPVTDDRPLNPENNAAPPVTEILNEVPQSEPLQTLSSKTTDIKHELEAPKSSFFEKRANQVKDSARPLFVPKKK